jgi:LemA protein
MKNQTFVFLALFLVIALVVPALGFILTYNGLVNAEKIAEEEQAQIATACQRRLDLLPNLIETVKGYARHEHETLVAITAARSKALAALQPAKETGAIASMSAVAATQADISRAMRGIFALVENYPDLKASSNFMALQDQFEGTENRIAVARQRFNTAVRSYNSRIQTFPGVLVAPLFGFGAKEYYEARPEAYEPIKAQL